MGNPVARVTRDHLRLQSVRVRVGEEWICERSGSSDELSFVLVDSGIGRHMRGALTQVLAPGDLLVADTTFDTRIRPAEAEDLVFRRFWVSSEHLFSLISASELRILRQLSARAKSPRIYPASSALAADCHRLLADFPLETNLDHRCRLLKIVSAVLSVERASPQRQLTGTMRTQEHMKEFFKDVSMSDLCTLSVSELARQFGCSRRHLGRLFQRYVGISVGALRMEMRLTKAAALLRDPEAKVTAIAEQCGFNHLGLFNICFKRRFGCSPSQWRKSPAADEAQIASLTPGEPDCRMGAHGLWPWSLS